MWKIIRFVDEYMSPRSSDMSLVQAIAIFDCQKVCLIS